MATPDDLVTRTCDALAAGEIGVHELTARHLGAHLGKTTSVLYHHWGSLDGFLHAVSQAGFAKLGAELRQELERGADLPDIAEACVGFGLDHPALYHVMFERAYDWDALRASGAFDDELPGMSLLSSVIAFFAGAGSDAPEIDARALHAGMHGLVSLANSGRANAGALDKTDRDAAIEAARRLAHRLVPPQHHQRTPNTITSPS
jgi:AcrR family transcriptional regulator